MKLHSAISNIFVGITFSTDEIILIESRFERITAKKGERLIDFGQVVDQQYFIVSGCLRSFHIDSRGREHTIQFGIRDWWISDYTAFFDSSKAIMNVEVIQDAELFKISLEDRDYLYKHIPKIEVYVRRKLEVAFASFQKRILSYLSHSACERYLRFIDTYPQIEQNIKNYHIASYLGITTETLSRIRKEISRT
ncbi:Crp/Fnr family transcriptional regulator [Winogradskyella sp. PG-2]|uniref:Crp/Fnr family transcriptional regulator n=1 Tax=Winogradskyella sp. PG-2 TaxID=754409 RepID=UPI000458612B|nr:Crp/Fnr family transcriptional regulator [Winogradskyella sp. PG-2]BAO76715.1 cAMP-binding proteins - catabolite gene activator and regulatory subunit of cAMP-dependent protein kinases [Winogradskyella sp. PG-2]